MDTYKYIDKDGKEAFTTAKSSDEAIKNAPNIGRQSGVQLYKGEEAGKVSGAQPDTGSSTGNGNVTTGTPTSDSKRYSRIPNNNDTNISDTEEALRSARDIPAPNKEDILTEKRNNAQALVNSVKESFNRELSAERTAGDTRNSRVAALNTTSGLGGSPYGSAKAQGQEDKNQQSLGLIEKERDAKINAILSEVDDRASEEYRQQRLDYIAGLEGNLASQKAAKEEDRSQAMNSLTGLASSGITLDQLRTSEPDVYATLKAEFGGADYELEAAYNNALPPELRTQYDTRIIRGKNGNAVLLRYGLNPITKQLEQKEYDLGQDYGTFEGTGAAEVKEFNGSIYQLDGQGNIKLLSTTPLTQSQITKNNSNSGGGGTTYKSGGLELTNDQLGSIGEELEKSKGPDNYIDPDVYQQLYDEWTQGFYDENGEFIPTKGLAKDFLAKFPPAKYVNPENTQLPTYLRNPKAKTTETPANPFR